MEGRKASRADEPVTPPAGDLASADAALREATAALTRAILEGSVIERAEARDRFDLALAAYSSLLDTTA